MRPANWLPIAAHSESHLGRRDSGEEFMSSTIVFEVDM
jgi:hypothetical protein